jgi:hypothetical protein
MGDAPKCHPGNVVIDPDATNRPISIIRKVFAARVANATFCSTSTQDVIHAEEINAQHSSDQDYDGPDRNLRRGVVRGRFGKMR